MTNLNETISPEEIRKVVIKYIESNSKEYGSYYKIDTDFIMHTDFKGIAIVLHDPIELKMKEVIATFNFFIPSSKVTELVKQEFKDMAL